MVSSGTAIAAGIGGLIAAEATGITNLSGGGGGKAPAVPNLPDSGPSTAELFALMQAGGSGGGVTRVIERGGGGDSSAGIANAFAQLQASNNQTMAALFESMNSGGGGTTIIERARGGTGTTGLGPTVERFTGSGPDGTNRTNRPGGPGVTRRQIAAASQGRDPFGLQATTEPGSRLGQAAETLRAAGDTPGNLAGNFGDPANSDGLAGFAYDAGAATGQGISEVRSWL